MICEGFQVILRHQADALLNLGVCSQFKDVLCQFWRKYLQKSRQAYTNNPIRSTNFKLAPSCVQDLDSESSAPESSVMSDSGTGDELPSSQHSRSGFASDDCSVYSGSEDVATYLSAHQKSAQGPMSMPRTLALCWLALLWTREALTLADLLRLVKEGHVPYVNAHECFPKEIRPQGRDSIVFRVESYPSHQMVHKLALKQAAYLDLPSFPPISHCCLLHPNLLTLRYLMEVNLPDELYDWVCRISEQSGSADVEVNTFQPGIKNVLPLYDVKAAALIIVTMKALYGMDDRTEWDLSSDAGDKNKEHAEVKVFSIRRWYRLVQNALTRAKQRQQEERARKQWKPRKPIFPSEKDASCVVKRRRTVEQLQSLFGNLSGSAPGPEHHPPSSFRFRWGEGEGVDGPSMHRQRVGGIVSMSEDTLAPPKVQYWLLNSWKCNSNRHGILYKQLVPTLPKSFLWLLELFSFLLDVKPSSMLEGVWEVEQRLFGRAAHRLRRARENKSNKPPEVPKGL
ncbi:TATA box-binding protein-associated factor RNA polymerase I subunit B isoform X2 [Lampris incognitus]|nr:TATA box-binding protein-associated factor RNA polymerase I subunit B isoform X2 [Lampris incognitus]